MLALSCSADVSRGLLSGSHDRAVEGLIPLQCYKVYFIAFGPWSELYSTAIFTSLIIGRKVGNFENSRPSSILVSGPRASFWINVPKFFLDFKLVKIAFLSQSCVFSHFLHFRVEISKNCMNPKKAKYSLLVYGWKIKKNQMFWKNFFF